MDAVREVRALRRLGPLEGRHLNVVLAREATCGWRRFTVRPEGCGHGRTGHQFLEVLLSLRQFRNARGQSARCAVGLRPGVVVEPELLEARVELITDLTGQRGQP